MSDLLPTADGRTTRAALFALLRTRRRLTAGTVVAVVAATGIGLLTPPLLGRVVDLVADGEAASALTVPITLIASVAVLQGALAVLARSLIARLGEGMLADLRERFVERTLGLPLARIEGAGSGDLTSRVTNDVRMVGDAVREAAPEFIRAILTIGLTLVGMAFLDWRFLVATLIAAPIQLHTVRWYVRRAGPLYRRQRESAGELQQELLETVGGAGTVRAFRLADGQVDRVSRRSLTSADLTLRAFRLQTRFFGRLNLAEYIGLSAVLAAGFVLVRDGHATIGAATAAALYFHNLFTPINIALVLIDEAQSAAASLARLVGVTTMPMPAEPDGSRSPADASVDLRDLDHSYVDGHPVLHGVSLSIGAGERVALVGASGAGKTTLAKIVAGVHRPTSGDVRLGGVRLAQLDSVATRRAVVLVSQEVHVFAGRLADDLRLAAPDATDEQLRSALATVHALDWAEALPEGLDTVVGEDGHRLTVAQAQQLALARLVLADPAIAVLDEATAEAGSAGARLLERAAARALAGRTGLVVAHRLTQAATADRVVVLEGGRIVESGPHEELVAVGGRYAALWQAWSTGVDVRLG